MSLTEWWLGARTSTVQKVCVRCDANDIVIVNGSTQTASMTTEDGTLVFDGSITGGSITVNGAVAASYPETSLPTGDFEIAFGSCQTPNHDMMYGHTLDTHNICAFFQTGDFIYETNTEAARLGGDFAAIVSMEDDAGVDNMYLQRRAIHQLPGFKKIAHKTPLYLIADDHDWCDPWDSLDRQGTIVAVTSITSAATTASVTTGAAHGYSNGDLIQVEGADQSEYNGHYEISNVAATTFDYTFAGSATSPATGTITVRKGESATGAVISRMMIDEAPADRATALATLTSRIVSANNAYIWRGCPDPVNRYYAFTISNTRFIVLDCMTNRSGISATDDSSKTMLGTTQKAWLKAELSAATETFKVIVNSKTPSFWSNPDSWGYNDAGVYGTELIELVKYIGDNSITGCIWIGGDHHHPCAIKYASGELQASPAVPVSGYEHIAINATPVGRLQDHDIPWGSPSASLPTGCEWRYQYYTGVGSDKDSDACFGKLVVTSEYLEMQIYQTNNRMKWAGRIYAGETKLKQVSEYLQVAI